MDKYQSDRQKYAERLEEENARLLDAEAEAAGDTTKTPNYA